MELAKTYIKCQPIRRCRERDFGPLGEVEYVPGSSFDFLPSLIGYFELAFEDDFHLMIFVFVDKRGAFLKAVETARDGLVRIIVVAMELSTCQQKIASSI